MDADLAVDAQPGWGRRRGGMRGSCERADGSCAQQAAMKYAVLSSGMQRERCPYGITGGAWEKQVAWGGGLIRMTDVRRCVSGRQSCCERR